jgi:hypothetical protein
MVERDQLSLKLLYKFYSWPYREFNDIESFDLSQLNLLILQSPLSYQFMSELKCKQDNYHSKIDKQIH